MSFRLLKDGAVRVKVVVGDIEDRRRGNSRFIKLKAAMMGPHVGKILTYHLPVAESQENNNVPPLQK
jgi:hypothetical protein